MNHNLLIIAAVSGELAGLCGRTAISSRSKKQGQLRIKGRLAGQSVRLLETGPGLVNTARALTAAIEAEKPTLVVQTGCAGGFEAAGIVSGDIGIASREIDVQLGLEAHDSKEIVSALPFCVMEKGALRINNVYPIDPDLIAKAHDAIKQEMSGDGMKIEVGTFVTVNTITATDARAKALHTQYSALMENMEGAAAAHVCLYYDIPFLEIRAASNRVGYRLRDSWNLPLAFERASKAVYNVVANLGLA